MAAVTVIACVAAAAPAPAQNGGQTPPEPFSNPPLEGEFPGAGNAQNTPTPSPDATRTPQETATPEPSPSPTATATATATAGPNGKNGRDDLPNTGSDPLRVGLMGLTLLGFGFSLRLGLTEARRRNA